MADTPQNQSPTFQTSQPDAGRHEISFDPDAESVSWVLPMAVAALEDRDPVNLPVLAEYVDPDALDALFQPRTGESSTQSNRTLFFPYGKYEARIHSEGLITLSVAEDTDME